MISEGNHIKTTLMVESSLWHAATRCSCVCLASGNSEGHNTWIRSILSSFKLLGDTWSPVWCVQCPHQGSTGNHQSVSAASTPQSQEDGGRFHLTYKIKAYFLISPLLKVDVAQTCVKLWQTWQILQQAIVVKMLCVSQ